MTGFVVFVDGWASLTRDQGFS